MSDQKQAVTITKLQQEVRDLKAWKESSMLVLSEWEKVWEATGKPGRLGASKAVSVREYLDKIRLDDSRPVRAESNASIRQRIQVNDRFLEIVNDLYCDNSSIFGELRQRALSLHADTNRALLEMLSEAHG